MVGVVDRISIYAEWLAEVGNYNGDMIYDLCAEWLVGYIGYDIRMSYVLSGW